MVERPAVILTVSQDVAGDGLSAGSWLTVMAQFSEPVIAFDRLKIQVSLYCSPCLSSCFLFAMLHMPAGMNVPVGRCCSLGLLQPSHVPWKTICIYLVEKGA